MLDRQNLILISINCLLALAAYLPLSTGLMVACFGTLMSIGAVVTAAAHADFSIPFFAAILLGGATAAVFGVFIALFCARLNGFLFAIATLSFGELARVIVINTDSLGGATGYSNVSLINYNEYLLYLLVTLAICFVLFYFFEKSSFRRALAVLRENEQLATTLGIGALRHRVVVIGASGFLAGIAGGFYIHHAVVLKPELYGFASSLLILMYPISGGTRTFLCPVIGAVLLTFLPDFLRFQGAGPERLIIYGAVLVLIMVLRPEGLLGMFRFPRGLSLKSHR
ncbi:MAG TPA: branched-chain amino acid ABC transporter permease [Pyrinomonadaceae bacterium]|jgi:branched-chain amino acid transport system permease protein